MNKIYLLEAYQRMGLGTTLIRMVAKRFLTRGIHSMILFSETENPSIYFYEHLGGEKIMNAEGRFNGAYGWRNLNRLADQDNLSLYIRDGS